MAKRRKGSQPPAGEPTPEDGMSLPPGAEQVNAWPGWMGPESEQEPRRRGDPRT
jgi:hypothetical protein